MKKEYPLRSSPKAHGHLALHDFEDKMKFYKKINMGINLLYDTLGSTRNHDVSS